MLNGGNGKGERSVGYLSNNIINKEVKYSPSVWGSWGGKGWWRGHFGSRFVPHETHFSSRAANPSVWANQGGKLLLRRITGVWFMSLKYWLVENKTSNINQYDMWLG